MSARTNRGHLADGAKLGTFLLLSLCSLAGSGVGLTLSVLLAAGERLGAAGLHVQPVMERSSAFNLDP